MPRCAGCGKRFKDHARVLQHMNHPRTICSGPAMVEHLVKASRVIWDLQQRRFQVQVGSGIQDHCPRTDAAEVNEAHDDCEMTMAENFRDDSTFDLNSFNYNTPEADMQDSMPNSESTTRTLDDPSPPIQEAYPRASCVYGKGASFMDNFDAHEHSAMRKDNLYYPFATRKEWEFASWLLRSNLSMRAIDELLSLQLIGEIPLSFHTAKELRGRAEMLPSGPEWTCKPIDTKIPTKQPVRLYLRDAIDCLQSLLNNPLLKDDVDLGPFRLFKTAEKVLRIYTEWMSGDCAWELQEQLPEGATLLGTILSSDKTTISAMTGDRTAYPLLISLANIRMTIRMKASHHAFLLLALLPVSKFIHPNKRVRGMLHNRLTHECLDIALEPLKKAASIGIMMSDPFGQLRYCFTPLAAYIVDTPEAQLLAGVGGKTSPLTMASHKNFGDAHQHSPRTSSSTLSQIQQTNASVDPWNDLGLYLGKAGKLRLNGVHEPFWRDWIFADPCKFLTPEPLHHWHKQFWDHDVKWCIRAVGETEIDFRFSILQPRTGFRHFKEGISKVKQVTGREHRDIQRYIIGIIADAAPREVILAIRGLMDFRYLAQSPAIDDSMLLDISAALRQFHSHKQAIVDAGARVGKGNKAIDHFYIPKLELLQSVVSNVRFNGVPIQWSADVTEHAHITNIKDPARAGNNQDYDSQICRYLDRLDKCRRFDLATAMREARVHFGLERKDATSLDPEIDGDDDEIDDGHLDAGLQVVAETSSLLPMIKPVSHVLGPGRLAANYFEEAESLCLGEDSKAPRPYRTFSCSSIAFHLTRDPSYKRMAVDDAAVMLQLPDLRGALLAFVSRLTAGDTGPYNIGGRRLNYSDQDLPFETIQVWCRLRTQTKSIHNPDEILAPQTLNCYPPSGEWPFGRCDAVLVNTDGKFLWPTSGLSGHCVCQMRVIMRPVPHKNSPLAPGLDVFLAYVQRFDFVSHATDQSSGIRKPLPDPTTGMHVLKRSLRSDQTRIGDVVPVTQIRAPIPLIPRFGEEADPRWTKESSFECSREFFLNKYFDKELYFSLRT